MQDNAGDFVNDCVKDPGVPKAGAGLAPRICDFPILLLTLFMTLCVMPVTFVVCVMIPMAMGIELYYGSMMRAAFCSPANQSWIDLLLDYSEFGSLLQAIFWSFTAAFVVFVGTKLPPCRLRARANKRPTATSCYLFGHAANAFLIRFTGALLIFAGIVLLVPSVQVFVWSWPHSTVKAKHAFCSKFIKARGYGLETCSDLVSHAPWFDDPSFKNINHVPALRAANHSLLPVIDELFGDKRKDPEGKVGIFTMAMLLLGGILACTLFFMPLIGSHLFVQAILATGPLIACVCLLAFVQYDVFGPVTMNSMGLSAFSQKRWNDFVSYSLALSLVLIPFHEEIRASLHTYYKRSLQLAYFHDGKDTKIADMAKMPYCPFILLTGTSSDFQPPGDTDTISELSFSSLHCGSEETGYVPQPEYRSLAKCTAITGAGCLDAISLTMNDHVVMRFWLEFLNLSWGDYVIFEPEKAVRKPWLGDWEGPVQRFIHRLPSSSLWFFIYLTLNVAWYYLKADDCIFGRKLFRMAMWTILIMVFLSFFSFVPVLDRLTLSPLTRQLHQATKFFYVGKRPPRMLYVTDGGVKDCTSLVQLLWRRCERILLVLAASDPNDDLAVLKAGMEVAKDLKLATFYDPDDPRRDLRVLFERYKQDKSQPYLHLGISYCWHGTEGGSKTGHLFIVKNRLPPDQVARPIAPPLTEEEIRGEEVKDPEDLGFDREAWEGLTTDQLGPFGCCDCCHTSGLNCGPRFPHGTFTGYLYLTPQWMNSLARLGHDVSTAAVDAVTRNVPLSRTWEANVGAQ